VNQDFAILLLFGIIDQPEEVFAIDTPSVLKHRKLAGNEFDRAFQSRCTRGN